jgi:hypothetical protein
VNCRVMMPSTRGLAIGLALLALASCAGGSGRTLGTPVDDDREWPQELTKDGSKLLLYQPQGTYGRGAAVWGDYGARGWAEAYNPRTDTYARTRQGSNVYGSWGTTAVRRGDDWARTARVSGTGGTAVATRTSSGGSNVVVRGDDNVYAGRDGQVYQRTGTGWERAASSGAATSPIDHGTVQSLNRDAQVRSQGAAHASQVQASRAAGGARPGGGMGGGGTGGRMGGGRGGGRR